MLTSRFTKCLVVRFFALLSATNLTLAANSAQAEDAQASPIAELGSATGKVSVLRNGEKISGSKGMKLFASDQLLTSVNSAAKVVFADGSNFMVMPESSIEVEAYWTEAHGAKTTVNSVFNVVRGKARFFFKPRDGGHEGTVKTANAIMGVRGTSFFVDTVKEKETELVVLTGVVAIHNPQNPDAEIMVKENETTSVSMEKPPVPAAPTKKEVIAKLEQQTTVLQEKIPDGQPAKDIELPAPTVPTMQGTSGSKSQIQRGTVIKQIISPNYAVIPIGAVMVSRANIACDKSSLDRFKGAAQNISPETPLLGKELAQCPGMQSEVLYWLGFFHLAQGETARAMELGKIVREKLIPLDSRSDREKMLQSAIEGNTSELSKQVKAKNSALARDSESLLVLARTYTRVGQFKDAHAFYSDQKKINALKPSFDASIENGYAYLLEGAYEDAERVFTDLRNESLDSTQAQAVNRGITLAQYKQRRISGQEMDFVEFQVENASDLNKHKVGGLAARWNSQMLNAELRAGDLTSEEPNKGWKLNSKTNFLQFLIGKRVILSSGVELGGLVGVERLGEKGVLAADASGFYRFGFGLGVGASFAQHALAFRELVPDYAIRWPVRTIGAVANYKRTLDNLPLAEFRSTFDLIGEYDTSTTQHVLGRIPIHNGRFNSDYLNLIAEGKLMRHSGNMSEYYSPLQETSALAGFEWNWFVGSLWGIGFKTGVNGGYGFINRKPQTQNITVTESNIPARISLQSSAKRELVESENVTRFTPTAELLIKRNMSLFINGNIESYADSDGQKTWNKSTVALGLRWNYNQAALQ